MAAKLGKSEGEGNEALAFVVSGAFAAVILLPVFALLDLKSMAAHALLGAALLAAARSGPLDPGLYGARLLQAWRWAALAVAFYALLQRLGLEPSGAYAQAGSQLRAVGTYGNAGYLAAFLCLSWPLYLGWPGRRRAAALALMLAALLATQSRAALVALVVQLAVLAWRGWRPGKLAAAGLAGALGLMLWLFPFAELGRFTWRWQLWRSSLRLWLERPLLGWGWNAYAGAIEGRLDPAMAQALAESGQYAEDPHQLLLALACAGGLAALSLFGLGCWLYAREAQRSEAPAAQALGLGALGLLVQSQFDRYFFHAGVFVPLLSGFAVLAWRRPLVLTGLGRWLAMLLGVAVLGLGALKALSHSKAVGTLMDQGIEALAPAQGLHALQRAVIDEPSAVNYDRLAAGLAAQRRYEEAALAYAEALRAGASRARAQNLGNCHMMLGRPEDAEAAYAQAVALEPGSADAHFSLGYALFHQNKIKEAVAALDQALGLDPGHAHAAKLKEQILQ